MVCKAGATWGCCPKDEPVREALPRPHDRADRRPRRCWSYRRLQNLENERVLDWLGAYWYRGGREAWEVNGLPQTELVADDW